MRYDVVVVGARVAGAATAMLLARGGARVLAVDRARFPSDTLSTHQVQLPGVALLREWGILDRLPGAPLARTARFDAGHAVIQGAYPGGAGVCSPRRTLLDAALVDAAREAGAEVWEGFDVTAVRPGRVEGRFRGSGPVRAIEADLVVGADGKHSAVARGVGAREYRRRPVTSGAFYAYVDGLGLTGGEMYPRADRLAGAWPTNDGLAVLYLAVPRARFEATRAELARDWTAPFRGLGDLAERLAAARRVEHVRATVDLPNTFREPRGPGWALVGDAGLVMDPITGQGIANALRDAEALGRDLLSRRWRDRRRRAMYDLTTGLAAFRRDRVGGVLYPAIAADPAECTRFLGALTGVEPADRYFGPGNLLRLVGARGLARIVTGSRPTPRAA